MVLLRLPRLGLKLCLSDRIYKICDVFFLTLNLLNIYLYTDMYVGEEKPIFVLSLCLRYKTLQDSATLIWCKLMYKM